MAPTRPRNTYPIAAILLLSLSESALAQATSSSSSVELPQIEVQAPATRPTPPTGVVGQPPVPYAGGQVGTGTRLGILGNRTFLTTPFNVTGYTAKLISDQQARTIADVVQNDPSVRNDVSPFSERDAFFIRGFSVVALDTAFDSLFYIANPRRSFTEGIERVEILKGPSALISGGLGRIGGTINLVPKRATDEPLTRVTTSFASRGNFGTHIDMGRRFGPANEWGVRLNTSYRGGATALDHNSLEVGNVALGLDYRGERFRASLDLIHSKQNVRAPTSLFNSVAPNIAIPRAPSNHLNTSSMLEYINSRYSMAAGRVEYDLLPQVTVYAAGGISRYYEDFLQSSYRITSPTGQATNTLAIQPQEIQGLTGEVGLRAQFDTGFIGHQLNISVTQASNTAFRGGFNPIALPSWVTNIYNPVYLPRGVFPSMALPNSSSLPLFAQLTARSVAVADTLSFGGDRVQLTLGGRYQSIDSRAYNTRPGPTLGAQTYSYQEGKFTPAVALVVRPFERLSIYGNYVEALTEGPAAPATAANANTIFAPTVNKQMEIGAKYDFGAVAVAASLFEIRQPNAFTDPATNLFSVSGLQRNRGAELTVFGELMPGVRLLGGVTFIDARLANTVGGRFNGNTAPGVPAVAVNLYGEYDMPSWLAPGLTLTGRVIYTGKQFYDQANTQSIPAWTRFDAGLRYVFQRPAGKDLTIRVAVENVFNNSYWATASRGFLSAGAPRTFLVSTTFDF